MKNWNMVPIFLAVLVYSSTSYDLNDGDIFEGDIIWDDNAKQHYKVNSRKRGAPNAVPGNVSYTWDYKTTDNGGSLTYTVPYRVSGMNDTQSVVYVRLAMKEWNKGTCILFVPRTTESNYVNFVPGSTCSSHVGMRGGEQNVTINNGCQYDQGALMHELGHVLGLFHEHTRTDRDQYVQILVSNLLTGTFDTNFKKMTHDPRYVWGGNYDYISVMHYGRSDYSKPPYNLTTIRTVDPHYQDAIGQRSVLSSRDVEKVNFIYNCDCKIVNTTHTYTRRYWGQCSILYFITWRCIMEEEVTEIRSKKMCTDLITNDTD